MAAKHKAIGSPISPPSPPEQNYEHHNHNHHQQPSPSSSSSQQPGGAPSSSLRTIIEKQQQIIAGQAEMIETLGRQLAHRSEELSRCAAIKGEMERLVLMTERAEEEAGEQVAALEAEVLRLTALLEGRGAGS